MIRETEVDGVPTLLAPKSGPLAAGLTFRVGRADETLATSGITHLIEHLALFQYGLSDYHYNGATGSVVTHFHLQGPEEDIVKYLMGVCEALGDLPLDRLETEKDILRTEAAGHNAGVADAMPLWRYGAQGYGLVSYEELGMSRLTADDLRSWSATWFTRQNVALWITSDHVPSGLRLRLPDGVRRPVPQPSSALPTTPAYFNGRANGVVMDAVVRRRTAASVFSAVLERELYRSLRQEGGYSYVATASYDPRGDDFATITAIADALPDKQDAVLGGFVDVLAKLRVGRIDSTDLDSVRAKAEEALRHEDRDAARLPGEAMNLLTGQPNSATEELLDKVRKVTVDDVHAVAVEASGSALLLVPAGLNAEWAGFAPAPTYSTAAVDGQRYASRQSDKVTLVVGPDGVSIVDEKHAVTVRYSECAVATAWPDGGRQLTGLDGIVVRVEPTLYYLPPATIAYIDARLPQANLVVARPRDPSAIPQPRPMSPVGNRPGRTAAQKATVAIMVALTVIMGLLTALCGGSSIAADPQNPDDAIMREPVGYCMIAGALAATIACAAGTVRVWRQRRAT